MNDFSSAADDFFVDTSIPSGSGSGSIFGSGLGSGSGLISGSGSGSGTGTNSWLRFGALVQLSNG